MPTPAPGGGLRSGARADSGGAGLRSGLLLLRKFQDRHRSAESRRTALQWILAAGPEAAWRWEDRSAGSWHRPPVAFHRPSASAIPACAWSASNPACSCARRVGEQADFVAVEDVDEVVVLQIDVLSAGQHTREGERLERSHIQPDVAPDDNRKRRVRVKRQVVDAADKARGRGCDRARIRSDKPDRSRQRHTFEVRRPSAGRRTEPRRLATGACAEIGISRVVPSASRRVVE